MRTIALAAVLLAATACVGGGAQPDAAPPASTTDAAPGGTATPGDTPGSTPAEPSTATPTDEAGSASGAGDVTIVDFSFDPQTVEVQAGTEITWTNQDVAAHTVTADQGGAFDSEVAADGGTFSVTLDEPGTYAYHCEFHPQMEATIEVTG